MNKKIKIIEIFNIISKGDYEALPLNIKVDGKKYNWDTLEHFYNQEDRDREDLLELATVYDTVTFLDMNAEILDNVEDNTEEIEELDEEWTYIEGQVEKTWSKSELELVNKINELVRTYNKSRKENKK